MMASASREDRDSRFESPDLLLSCSPDLLISPKAPDAQRHLESKEDPLRVFRSAQDKTPGDLRSSGAVVNGEGGIRTHDDPEAIPVFETGAFNRSATSPEGPPV
jgi:hypothetical protein